MSTPLYGLDIETDTTIDGLDPGVAAVVAVAVATQGGDHVLLGDEHDVLTGVDALLGSLAPGVIVTWNGAGFDLPFLAQRADALGIDTGLRLWSDPRLGPDGEVYRGAWHAHDHLDGYRLYRADVGRSLGFRCGLKPMARLVGLRPVEVDRSGIHELRRSDLHDYVASDARLARELVLRRWPAAAPFADRCHTTAPG
ncbi:MAG: hypothetical protein JST64_01545 [Actinobacteria bacterium]|nr:hypothetical protein [Actinomycetota bacterium]